VLFLLGVSDVGLLLLLVLILNLDHRLLRLVYSSISGSGVTVVDVHNLVGLLRLAGLPWRLRVVVIVGWLIVNITLLHALRRVHIDLFSGLAFNSLALAQSICCCVIVHHSGCTRMVLPLNVMLVIYNSAEGCVVLRTDHLS